MQILRFAWLAAFFALFGCGGPVPSGVFLTLSVSTAGVAVATSVNGKHNEFMSSENGWMSGGGPLNALVHEGENEVSFMLNAVETEDDEEVELGFSAYLEVVMKDEIVNTLEPSARTLFTRELSEAESAALRAGETVTITQTFIVDLTALEAMISGSN